MSNDWLGLSGKVIVVTGGGSGIGERVAWELAAVGAVPVTVDLKADAAAAVADAINARYSLGATAFGADVTDRDAVWGVFDAVKAHHGSIHGLVNAAGLLRAGELADVSLEDWDLTLRIDLTGCFLAAQAAARHLDHGGAVVHISSIAGSQPQPFSGSYSPAKAGLTMLSRQMAFEWGPRGFRSNVVSPGLVRTPMSEAFYQAPGVLEARERAVPLRRIATPQDMADVALFLLSERASYVTGQEIVVDGGFSAALMSFVPRPGFSE